MSVCIHRSISSSNSFNRMLNDYEIPINASSIDELEYYNLSFDSALEEEIYRERLSIEMQRRLKSISLSEKTTQYIEEYKVESEYDFNIVELDEIADELNNNGEEEEVVEEEDTMFQIEV